MHIIGYTSYSFENGNFILESKFFEHIAKESELGSLELEQHHITLLEVQRSPSLLNPLIYLTIAFSRYVCLCNLGVAVSFLGKTIYG